CYSQGGQVMCINSRAEADANPGTPARKPDDYRPEGYMAGQDPNVYADGGFVAPQMPVSEEYRAGQRSVYHALRHKARFAEGGIAHDDMPQNRSDDMDNSDVEHGNYEDDLSYDTLGKELYDTDQLSAQPMDSNETDDARERNEEN